MVVSSQCMAIPRETFLGDMCADSLDHVIVTEVFNYNAVFTCFDHHLSIFVSVVCFVCCSALCSAQHSQPYLKVGVMTVLHCLFFGPYYSRYSHLSHLEGSSTSVGRPGNCQSPVLAIENIDVRQPILFDVSPGGVNVT